jgi:hypothetical protein
MDILKTVREIGFFESAVNISPVAESREIIEKAGAAMPLPSAGVEKRIEDISEWLISSGKKKYMFLSPEIALIESISKKCDASGEAIIVVPCDMDKDAAERLSDNLPRCMTAALLNEPYFPEFVPADGMIIACGYTGAGRTMVLPETYRMIEHYGGFMGRKVFLPYTELKEAVRFGDWIEINTDKFTDVWRNEE